MARAAAAKVPAKGAKKMVGKPVAKKVAKPRRTSNTSMQTRDTYRSIGRNNNGNPAMTDIFITQHKQEKALRKMWAKDKKRKTVQLRTN